MRLFSYISKELNTHKTILISMSHKDWVCTLLNAKYNSNLESNFKVIFRTTCGGTLPTPKPSMVR